jgi:hypothetical protein
MTAALPELAKGDCAKGTAIRFDFPEGWLELESATLEAGSTVQEIADLVPWATEAKFFSGGQTADEDQDLGIGPMPGDGIDQPATEQADPASGTGDDKAHPVRIYGADYARENGIRRIVLLEGHRYRWKVTFDPERKSDQCPVTTSFDPRRKADPSDSRKVSGFRFVQCDHPKENTDGWSGAFSVRNYFGCAFLKVADIGEVWFEIVPRKVDYLLHFRAMMADLSGRAEEMLLDWSAPASQPLAPAPESEAVLIQQFNMLVNGIGTDRLRQWLRAVKRNPHRALASEARWEPASSARPDAFLKDPLRHGRDWGRVPDAPHGIPARGGPVLPQEILAHRKFDSFDTPPNRFVKFAIGQFAGICRKVLAVFEAKRGRDKSSESRLWPAEIEAANLLEELESIRKDSFFDEVGALRSLPLNNQTLQKRHGYREILKAWTRVRRATKFKWEAFEEEFFLGDSRDVPTLYEYWVFFQLREVIGRIPKPADAPVEATGIKPVGEAGGDLAFLQPTDEGGALNLKEGKTILCRYTWDSGFGNPLRLHLYFNRSFPASHSGPDETASVARIFSAGCPRQPGGPVQPAGGDRRKDHRGRRRAPAHKNPPREIRALRSGRGIGRDPRADRFHPRCGGDHLQKAGFVLFLRAQRGQGFQYSARSPNRHPFPSLFRKGMAGMEGLRQGNQICFTREIDRHSQKGRDG